MKIIKTANNKMVEELTSQMEELRLENMHLRNMTQQL